MIAVPRVFVSLPPVHVPRVGDRVEFELPLYGLVATVLGKVSEVGEGWALVAYAVALPPIEEIREKQAYLVPINYPKTGIQSGVERLRFEDIRPYTGSQLSVLDKAVGNDSAIARLESERDRLLSEGEIALQGAWIATGKVSGRPNWVQAFWMAEKAIFDGKRRRYIGRVGSEKHKKAQSAYQRRQRLERIEKQIKILGELS